MKLSTIVSALDDPRVDGDAAVEVAGITCDSRAAGAGDLFVAVRGFRTDGNRFAADAARRGAVAILSGEARAEGTAGAVWIRVPDDRVAMAQAAAQFYRHPDRELTAVGITGTNGKTTTAYLLESILSTAGHVTGLVGTVAMRWPGRELEAARTTPESVEVYRHLREMVDAGCSHAVLEVSSHALALERVHGLRFGAGVFTNLSQDHLDFHENMAAYFDAKASLFESLDDAAVAVLNADDPRCAELEARTKARVLRYGMSSGADVRARSPEFTLSGTTTVLATPEGDIPIESPLPGPRNLENVLAAAAAALAVGVAPDALARGVRALRTVPGRFERIQEGQPFEVIVDYAHTDDALRKLLAVVRSLAPARVITVFGCGGDRDRTKRPLMGEAAASGSDVVVLTSDNPRGEDPEAIADGAEQGVEQACRAAGRPIETHRILDRRDAIRFAIDRARPGDMVVIAGKGHENVQVIGGRALPFDDRDECRAALRERPGSRG